MAIVIDATVGVLTSNSYVTEAEALTYFEGRLNSSAYDDATDENKRASLVNATHQLDRVRFLGSSTNGIDIQVLQWPRCGLVDVNGRTIADSAIPKEIKHAQMELALGLLASDIQGNDTLFKFKKIKVDTIELEPSDMSNENRLPPEVRKLIKHFISSGQLIR